MHSVREAIEAERAAAAAARAPAHSSVNLLGDLLHRPTDSGNQSFEQSSCAEATDAPPPLHKSIPASPGTRPTASEDLSTLSVSSLKQLIVERGMSHDDCIEKSELQARARQALSVTFTSPQSPQSRHWRVRSPVSEASAKPAAAEEARADPWAFLERLASVTPELRELLEADERLARYSPSAAIAEMCDGLVLRGCSEAGSAVAIKIKFMSWCHPEVMQMFSMIQQREIAFNELLTEQDPHSTHPVCRMLQSWETPVVPSKPYLACMVFECLGQPLSELFEATRGVVRQSESSLPLASLRVLARDVLRALAFTSRLGIIHGDIKPENICESPARPGRFELIDFDSSLVLGEPTDEHIQPELYRAPEVILGLKPYDCRIDVFGLGVILVELYTGDRMFAKQSNCAEQLVYLGGLVGFPAAMLQKAPNQLGPALGKLEEPERVGVWLPEMGGDDQLLSAQFKDLVCRMLHCDPQQRISALKALEHEFCQIEPPQCDQ